MRPLIHPDLADITLADIFYGLGDPARLAILRNLLCACDLTCAEAAPDLPKSTMSHHFRILRDSGLIQTRRDGTAYRSQVRRTELETRFPGLLAAIEANLDPADAADPGNRRVEA